MRTSMKRFAALTLATAATTAALLGAERDARACGGCFAPPSESESVVTDHRMILSISSKQTTLYDQIRYSGSPSSFAWVLPIADSNAAQLGLSADVVFASLDALTTTRVQQPPLNCPSPPDSCSRFGGAATPTAGNGKEGADDGVTVNKHEVVGPYVTDYLHSTDPQALNTWLTAHGYAVPADVAPVISAYVTEHYDFIAMKLVPGAGVSAMRPVRVSTPGASPTLPLRMIAAGSGPTVGITLWILGDGRYETTNFPSFIINSADITWDWASNGSDYTTLRAQNEASLQNKGWEIESSINLSQDLVKNVVLNGGNNFGGGRPIAPADAGSDYLPVAADSDAGDAGTFESADAVRTADLETLFAGIDPYNMRVTRVRSDLAHASLTSDLTLGAAADQSELSNIRIPTKEAGQPLCPVYSGCDQVGTAPRDQAAAQSHDSSFSCATRPMSSRWPWAAAIAVGLAGLQIARRRRRSQK